MRRLTMKLLTGLLTAGISVGVAASASAVNWYSSSAPLNVYESGAIQGQAYGNYFNYQNTWASSQSTRRDNKPGGDGIFVHTDYYFNWGGTGYTYWADSRTNNTTSGSWLTATYSTDLPATAHSSRGKIHVCEDHSFAGDPCSADTYPTFSY